MAKETIKKSGSNGGRTDRDSSRPTSGKRVSDSKKINYAKKGGGTLNPGPGKNK